MSNVRPDHLVNDSNRAHWILAVKAPTSLGERGRLRDTRLIKKSIFIFRL